MKHFIPIGFAVAALVMGVAHSGESPPGEPRVVGIAFVGRTVADLDRSVAFYTALGFKQDMRANPAWREDDITGHLYGVKGGQTRMAKMLMNSGSSGKEFAVYLREFKGIADQKRLDGYATWQPGAPHVGIVVTDGDALLSRLKSSGMLRARSRDGVMVVPPGQTRGTAAYIRDPDGLDVEILQERTGDAAFKPGVNHVGLVVSDLDKARGFYETLLAPAAHTETTDWRQTDRLDALVGGQGVVLRVRRATFAEAADPAARMDYELVQYQNRGLPVPEYTIHDIGTSFVGFEVKQLDAFLARAVAAGARPVSDAGPLALRSGTRAVIVRDPDVGGFVLMYEQ